MKAQLKRAYYEFRLMRDILNPKSTIVRDSEGGIEAIIVKNGSVNKNRVYAFNLSKKEYEELSPVKYIN